MASVSPFDLIVLVGAAVLIALAVGLFIGVRRILQRRRRRSSSRSYAKTYFNDSLTREQIAAAAREQRERAQARLAAAMAEQDARIDPHGPTPVTAAPPSEAVPAAQPGELQRESSRRSPI